MGRHEKFVATVAHWSESVNDRVHGGFVIDGS
jgi:hypothetical protein